MADEELKLTVRTEEFVQKLNEVQKVIQSTKKEMNDLYDTNKKGFSDITKLREYETKMSELKNKLSDVTKEEEKLIDSTKKTGDTIGNASKSTDEFGEAAGGLVKKLGLAAIAIALITKLVREVVVAFKDTVFGMKAITIVSEVWKQIAYNIATVKLNIVSFTASLEGAIMAGKMMNEQRKEERKDIVLASQLREDYNKLYFESADRTKSNTYQLDKLNKTLEVHNKMINVEIENAKRQLVITEVQLANRPKSNKLLDQEAKLLAQINMIEGQRYSETKRVEMRRSSLENTIREENMKKYIDEIEERLKIQDEFQALSLKLMDEYDKTQIDLLEGNDKIRAQRDYGLKQLEEFRKQMEKLGKLSKEQEKQFAILGAGVWVAFYEGLTEEAQKKLPQKDIDAISKVLLPQLQGIIKKDVPKEMADIKSWVASNKEFSVWNLLGLDPDDPEDQEGIEAIKDAANRMQEIFEDIFDQRVEMAERERELLDTKISETQREVELEAELMKEGFANNLTARQQYLEQLKKERAKALAEEEKAIKAQRSFETILQTINLITASSEVMKTFSKIPIVGIPLGIAMIATMFGAFIAAKAKAANLTKMAEGGSGTETGITTGKRHSEGGERFLDHVEIEQGEQWGVLSRRASGKYGEVFHDMVSSFNKDQMPEFITPVVSNSIRVDNNGSNTRLDRVIKEQEKMNQQLRQGQMYSVGNKQIIKKGNKIRIIG